MGWLGVAGSGGRGWGGSVFNNLISVVFPAVFFLAGIASIIRFSCCFNVLIMWFL